MKSHHYPHIGQKKRPASETARTFEQAYSEFVSENQRQKQSTEQELDRAIQRLCQLNH
ncbi:hypothetical protein ACYKO2_06850 [Streptococcus suis]